MINYGYFRHRFDAHNDPKLMMLKGKRGLAGYAAYFILLEIFGDTFNQDEAKKPIQEIHLRRIASALELRSDSTRTVLELMSELELIDPLRFKSDSSTVELGIPNFLKYYGSYKKTEGKKSLNKIKENKIKENKEEEEEYTSPQFDLQKPLLEKKEPTKKQSKKIDHNSELVDSLKCLDDAVWHVAKRMSQAEQVKIVERYGFEAVENILIAIARWPKYESVNSVYLTALEWIRRDSKREKTQQVPQKTRQPGNSVMENYKNIMNAVEEKYGN